MDRTTAEGRRARDREDGRARIMRIHCCGQPSLARRFGDRFVCDRCGHVAFRVRKPR